MGISFLFSFAFSFSSFLSYLDPKFPLLLAESSFSINFLDPPTMPTLLALSALRRDVPGSPGQAFLLVASVCIGSVEAKEVGSGPWLKRYKKNESKIKKKIKVKSKEAFCHN